MKYPISYPLAGFLSILGVKLVVRIEFIHDKEANVFIATSKDIEGLVIEASNFEELLILIIRQCHFPFIWLVVVRFHVFPPNN